MKNSGFFLWEIKKLLVDILYEDLFHVHIVEIIVHFVLLMIQFQVYKLHVHVKHYQVILKKNSIKI